MAKIDYKKSSKDILKLIGGKENVVDFTNCQTRLRINVKDVSNVNSKELNKVDGSLGVNITGQQVQIIFGTGKVIKAASAFEEISEKTRGAVVSLEDIAAENKNSQKSRNTSAFQRFLGKFSNIFAPLILGFIGAGILGGIGGMLQSLGMHSVGSTRVWDSNTIHSWYNVFSVLLNIWKGTFLVIVGWRTAEVFGGSGVMGAIIAGLYVTAASSNVINWFIPESRGGFNFLGMHIADPIHNWLTVGLRPGVGPKPSGFKLGYPSGSVFGVMISAGIVGLTEKGFRKFVPNSLDTVLTPTFTLLSLLALNIVLIMPVSGYIFTGVAFLFQHLYGNPFGAALLSGIFLVTVVFGVHQGFVPIYAALITSTGVNGLFPILGMAGAGQVGMAIALWLKAEKDGTLRKQIQGAIIPGFLGIGEPLIYGVSLPRVKPFITASLGGALGGFFIGAINLWGGDPVGLNTMFGPSGLLAAPLMTSVGGSIAKGVMYYLAGLGISYIGGFGFTWFFGHKNVDLT